VRDGDGELEQVDELGGLKEGQVYVQIDQSLLQDCPWTSQKATPLQVSHCLAQVSGAEEAAIQRDGACHRRLDGQGGADAECAGPKCPPAGELCFAAQEAGRGGGMGGRGLK